MHRNYLCVMQTSLFEYVMAREYEYQWFAETTHDPLSRSRQ